MTILNTIADYAKERYNGKSVDDIKQKALSLPKGNFEFEKALMTNELSFICEVKKASPSKGVIAEYFPYLEIAKEYENAGASAISCLTEPKWFMGSDKYLEFQFQFFARILQFVNIRFMSQSYSVQVQFFLFVLY